MPEKSRIKNLSTRFLKPYRVFTWMVLLTFFIAIVYGSYSSFRISSFILPMSWAFILYRAYVMNKKLYHVEFDDEYLFVLQKNQDMLIPLENIKDIELKSLIGHWEIIFYNAEQLGNKIYFKPSLLYPFNSKKKDELVNILWSNVENAKRKKQDFQRNALRS